MIRLPPESTRTDTPFPSAPLFRSGRPRREAAATAASRGSRLASCRGRVPDSLLLQHLGLRGQPGLDVVRRHVHQPQRALHDVVEHRAGDAAAVVAAAAGVRSEEPTSELQSLMRTTYAPFFLKKK